VIPAARGTCVRRAQELCLAHGTDDRLVPLDAAAATATGSRKMQMGIGLRASTRTLGVNRCAAISAICRHIESRDAKLCQKCYEKMTRATEIIACTSAAGLGLWAWTHVRPHLPASSAWRASTAAAASTPGPVSRSRTRAGSYAWPNLSPSPTQRAVSTLFGTRFLTHCSLR
jgi:hypothetical protein